LWWNGSFDVKGDGRDSLPDAAASVERVLAYNLTRDMNIVGIDRASITHRGNPGMSAPFFGPRRRTSEPIR
jgi:hypothetical protein